MRVSGIENPNAEPSIPETTSSGLKIDELVCALRRSERVTTGNILGSIPKMSATNGLNAVNALIYICCVYSFVDHTRLWSTERISVVERVR